MQHTIENSTVFDEVNLVTPSADQKYPLGKIITISEKANSSSETASKGVKQFMYVKSHGALTQYQPYVIKNSATAGAEVVTAAPATNTQLKNRVCVPQVAFPSGYYGWVQIYGDCTVKTTSATYAAGDALELLNGGTTLVIDGAASGANYFSTNTVAVCKSAGATLTSVNAFLLGLEKAIQAT